MCMGMSNGHIITDTKGTLKEGFQFERLIHFALTYMLCGGEYVASYSMIWSAACICSII